MHFRKTKISFLVAWASALRRRGALAPLDFHTRYW